jgi:hypothetical protein
VAARFKAWFCGRSLAEIVGSNRRRGYGSLSLAQVMLSGSGLCVGLIALPDCGVSECDRDASIM